jgi:uncharacterized protein (TIGR03086 family)
MNSIYDTLRVCVEEAARVARAVPGDRLDDPTPCGQWSVRDLANHLVLYTAHGREHRARRTELPQEYVERDFTAQEDWAERYAAQLCVALDAWSRPSAREGTIGSGASAAPAADYVAMLAQEAALHGWDLARSTGQEYRLPEAAASAVLTTVRSTAAMYREYDGFAPAVPVGGSVFEQALAASGRDPGWTAAGAGRR